MADCQTSAFPRKGLVKVFTNTSAGTHSQPLEACPELRADEFPTLVDTDGEEEGIWR